MLRALTIAEWVGDGGWEGLPVRTLEQPFREHGLRVRQYRKAILSNSRIACLSYPLVDLLPRQGRLLRRYKDCNLLLARAQVGFPTARSTISTELDPKLT
jgi:hypothetical protein